MKSTKTILGVLYFTHQRGKLQKYIVRSDDSTLDSSILHQHAKILWQLRLWYLKTRLHNQYEQFAT